MRTSTTASAANTTSRDRRFVDPDDLICPGCGDQAVGMPWHNARFKALAEELGIEVSKDARIGWSPTTIPAATREEYAPVVAELGRALRLHRSVEITEGGETKKPGPPPCLCECGRRIRVSPTVLAAGPITCGVCGTDFEPA